MLSASTVFAQAGATPAGGTDDGAWIGFTVVTSLLVGEIGGDDNVKLDDFVYIPEPLGRGLTMIGIAVHPFGYDRGASSLGPGERLALVVGGTVTPAGGFGAGGSYMLLRGLSVTTGLAMLVVNAAKDDKGIVGVPADFSDPFEVGWARGWFVGASYTFGR